MGRAPFARGPQATEADLHTAARARRPHIETPRADGAHKDNGAAKQTKECSAALARQSLEAAPQMAKALRARRGAGAAVARHRAKQGAAWDGRCVPMLPASPTPRRRIGGAIASG